MAGFITISPTHIQGKKEYAWNKFLEGGYIAVGWIHTNLEGNTLEEVIEIIRQENFENETSAIENYRKFYNLRDGDYVAVNNVNDGLFGVGIVLGNKCFFSKYGHDTGSDSKDEFYSQLRKVDWKYTNYIKRKVLVGPGETGWSPYGTMGGYWEEAPSYIKRLIGEEITVSPIDSDFEVPEYLAPVIELIERLRKKPDHMERAHESLVEDFLCAIGYQKHLDITFQKGRVDVVLSSGNIPQAIIEVKKNWNLSQFYDEGAIAQAYRYALDQGVRYVIITNGDYYLLFDRLKGLSISSNIIGEFTLSTLKEDDLDIIERLKKENLSQPNLVELFRHISESFKNVKD